MIKRDTTGNYNMELPPPASSTSSSSSSSPLNWAPPQPASSPTACAVVVDREHMFEKVVTPSDVGKLNRLVIPKQHAERYFPLDPSSEDVKGGLHLSFEEGPTGRPWRFRYSYWNSSQSYVMTKGWSRFVKDKRLDAGDTVSFSRSPHGQRLFIDWRHRHPPPPPPPVVPAWAMWSTFLPHPQPLPLYFRSVGPTLVQQQQDHLQYGGILESVPVMARRPKRQLRLFGVDLECREHEQRSQPTTTLPLQWGLTAATGPPARNYSELQLLPPPPTTDEARR